MKPLRIINIILLFPFSILYGIVVFSRNKLFDLKIIKSVKFNIPVISVGNITVGGTGKTPHVEYLISLLKEKCNLATLSRGYKRKTKKFIIANEKTSTPSEIGDEPLQIKHKYPNITVAVDKKRADGIKKLISQAKNLEVIILDDAFQHRYITPGISILLMDYNRPVSKDCLLPAGRLREFVSSKKRADFIIISKCPSDLSNNQQEKIKKNLRLLPTQKLFFSSIEYKNIKGVFNKNSLNTNNLRNKSIVLVTGIANPSPLKSFLKKYTENTLSLTFPDHHSFSLKDIKKIETVFHSIENKDKIIITTEKDAIRLKAMKNISNDIKSNLYYVPIKFSFLNKSGAEFNRQIVEYVRKNK